jgi:hypothetical protein
VTLCQWALGGLFAVWVATAEGSFRYARSLSKQLAEAREQLRDAGLLDEDDEP